MAQVLQKFVPRAPRYVIRPGDSQFLRFAHLSDEHKTYSTKLLNVSATGLAFVAERDYAPQLGDIIKVEFAVPGGEQVAWWARVVRLQEHNSSEWVQNKSAIPSDDIVVGLHFHDMPIHHKRAIGKAIDVRYAEIRRQQNNEFIKGILSFARANLGKTLLYAICTFLTFYFLYSLSRPGENYDAKRGAPWGERFKF